MSEHLKLTCPCGGTLEYTGSYPSTQVAKFNTAHQICRERERPLVMWGGDQA